MLLRSVTITDPASSHHGQLRDLRITAGRVAAIAPALAAQNDEPVYEWEAARIAPGFVDIGAYLGDPGHEEREDIPSLIAAAAAGGYVAVAALPNTHPVRQTVADLAYLNGHNGRAAAELLPLAALSHNAEGRDLTEMIELHAAGALAFTDGPDRITDSSLLKRALEYTKTFGGTVIATPYADKLAEEGQIHEGAMSVRLGLRGIPSMCETIPLRRNLELAAYTGGRLIVHLLSTAEGVDIVRRSGDAGARPLCTASAHHLSLTVNELAGFDPNFKLLPPLRAETDRLALLNAVLDGTVDAIVSHHQARHGEEKDLEFSYAAFGARGLETAFRQLLSVIDVPTQLDPIVTALTAGPRRLLGLPALAIEEGAAARLTLFTTTGSGTVTLRDLRGKTTNSPLLDRPLPGRILATVNNNRLWTSVS